MLTHSIFITQMPGTSTSSSLTRRRGSDRSLSGSAHELAVCGVNKDPNKVVHSHSQSNLSEIPYRWVDNVRNTLAFVLIFAFSLSTITIVVLSVIFSDGAVLPFHFNFVDSKSVHTINSKHWPFFRADCDVDDSEKHLFLCYFDSFWLRFLVFSVPLKLT